MKFLDYIESTGHQYIDIGLSASASTKIKIICRLTDSSQTATETFLGCRNNARSRYSLQLEAESSGDLKFYLSPGLNSAFKEKRFAYVEDDEQSVIHHHYVEKNIEGREWHTFEADPMTAIFTDGYRVFLDDGYIPWRTDNEKAFPYNIYLFAENDRNTAKNFAKMQLSDFEIDFWAEGEEHKQLRLTPALDDNNVPCLFELDTQEFYYNQGSGNFIAGNVVPKYFIHYHRTEYSNYTIAYQNVGEPFYLENPGETGSEYCIGWSTEPNQTYPDYYLGQPVVDIADEGETIDLYAVWRKSYGWLLGDQDSVYVFEYPDPHEDPDYLEHGTKTRICSYSELTEDIINLNVCQIKPETYLMDNLSKPRIYYWTHSIQEHYDIELTADVQAVPVVPQSVVMQNMALDESKTIKYITITSDRNTLFNVSFDGGSTWKMWDGSGWVTVSQDGVGNLRRDLERLNSVAWAVATTQIRFRMWGFDGFDFQSIRIEYND